MSAAELAQAAADLPAELAKYAETVEPEVKVDTPAEIVEPEIIVDPMAEKAAKGGWTNKDAWVEAGKDPDEWIDAKEFVSRKPLYDKLHAQAKTLKDREEKLEAVSKYAAKAAEIARNRTIAEYEAKRLQAVEVGDIEGFKEADKQLEEVRKDTEIDLPKRAEEAIPQAVTDFAARNDKWFEKDEAMTVFMVEMNRRHTAAGKPLDEALKLAEADVKREFAYKFINPNKDKPAAVGSGSNEARPRSYGYNDLDADAKQVWSVLKHSGKTLESFIADMAEQGAFKK